MNTVDKANVSAVLVGSMLAVGFGIQAIFSRNASGYDLFTFLAGFGLTAAIVWAYWLWLTLRQINLSFGMVFLWACVFRLIGLWGDPILEDDFYRYLLDACLFAAYGSPYGITPESLFYSNALTPECETLLSGVNNPHLATIYAPVLQYVFLLAYLISPVNLDLIQFIIVGFDLAIIVMLGKLAPPRLVLLYAWCPLVIKEFAFTAHPDVIGVALLLAALFCKMQSKIAWACILVSLAACTKILALVALPFILFRQPLRYWLIALATVVVLYLPFFIQQQRSDLEILAHFASTWLFNAPLFFLVSQAISDQFARYFCVAIFIGWYIFYFNRYQAKQEPLTLPRFDWVFGCLLLLSPVLNAWYWVWILPFAVLWPSAWAWTISVTIFLSYAIGLHLPDSELNDYQVHSLALWIQVICALTALVIDYRSERLKLPKPANDT